MHRKNVMRTIAAPQCFTTPLQPTPPFHATENLQLVLMPVTVNEEES